MPLESSKQQENWKITKPTKTGKRHELLFQHENTKEKREYSSCEWRKRIWLRQGTPLEKKRKQLILLPPANTWWRSSQRYGSHFFPNIASIAFSCSGVGWYLFHGMKVSQLQGIPDNCLLENETLFCKETTNTSSTMDIRTYYIAGARGEQQLPNNYCQFASSPSATFVFHIFYNTSYQL